MFTFYCLEIDNDQRRPQGPQRSGRPRRVLHTRTILTTIAILAALAAGSCKKKKEKVYPQYPPPSWKTEVTGQFTYTMTAVVKLPPELESANQAGDELAAFIGDQCRAVAEPVKPGSSQLFHLLITDDPAETKKDTISYFRASTPNKS